MILIEDLFGDNENIFNSGFRIVQAVWKRISTDISDAEEAKFVHAFIKGYDNRPSVRTSNPTGTKADQIIDSLIRARISSFSDKDIARVKFDHRLSMAAENIIGLILEEYIHVNVLKYGWSCCWGNSIKAVDFCSSDGKLLQVKNKSNTENSSSNKIRQGTEIIKWFRLNANNGKTNWDSLNKIIGKPALLSETGFKQFAEELIKKNPNVLYLDEETFLKVYN